MTKTFAEFFAGIGLVHLGLRAGGWRCVYANDIEPKKHSMYEAEFGPSPYYHVEDIWRTDRVMQHLRSSPFMATASFPCTDLSLAGHWRGFEGEHSSTYFGFLKVLHRLGDERPKVVMLENVFGFLTSRQGDDFQRAVLELADLGYWIDAIVLDARWFVPQSRPRAFVFGFHESLRSPRLVRRDQGQLFNDPWAAAIARTESVRPASLRLLYDRVEIPTGWATIPFAAPESVPAPLVDVLDLTDGQDWWDEEATQRHYEMMEAPSRGRVDSLIAERATTAGTAYRRTRRGSMRLEVRFDLAGCLRTPKGGSAKQIVVAIIEGQLRMRWMSAREYARLQGADRFNITVPPIQAMHGFGDAVCVPAIQWIDRHILSVLYDDHTRHEVSVSEIVKRADVYDSTEVDIQAIDI